MKKRRFETRSVLAEQTLTRGMVLVPGTEKVADWELQLLGIERDTRSAKQRRFERRTLLRRQARARG